MRLIYSKPVLKDLSQGSRIAFARQFRHLSQDNVSEILGFTGDSKRRAMTRYEKGDRNPKEDRAKEISGVLDVNYNAIKKYDYKNVIDLVYILMWLEEILPNYHLDLSEVPINDSNEFKLLINSLVKWSEVRNKWLKREITYEEYIDWKLNFDISGVEHE